MSSIIGSNPEEVGDAKIPNTVGTPLESAKLLEAALIILAPVGIPQRSWLARDFEDPCTLAAHKAHKRDDLIPGRQTRRDRAIVRGRMRLTTRGGEPRRASMQSVAQLTLHYRQIVLGRRLLEGPLTHRPSP